MLAQKGGSQEALRDQVSEAVHGDALSSGLSGLGTGVRAHLLDKGQSHSARYARRHAQRCAELERLVDGDSFRVDVALLHIA